VFTGVADLQVQCIYNTVTDNLCRNERQALFRLKSDKSIVIKEADKGNAVVILDREYYRDKILHLYRYRCTIF
jgi:hypothetical protein